MTFGDYLQSEETSKFKENVNGDNLSEMHLVVSTIKSSRFTASKKYISMKDPKCRKVLDLLQGSSPKKQPGAGCTKIVVTFLICDFFYSFCIGYDSDASEL